MKIENIDINLLTPYKNNAKKHPKKQIEQIMNSIREFGMNDPIGIWGKDNIIVEGHGRYLACKKLGMTEVPCIRLDNLTDEQRKAYTLAHNKVAESEFDWDMIELELEDINIDMGQFGFEFVDEEDKEPVDKKAKNQELRTNQIYNLYEFDPLRCEGRYQMPTLEPCNYLPKRMMGFNYAMSSTDYDATIHFYLDDYQFERIWNDPYKYFDILTNYKCVLTPAYSVYMDMSEPVKIYNVYRSRLLGQMMQNAGMNVIPIVYWADEKSFDYCFDGLPENATLSTYTVGTKDPKVWKIWKAGMDELIKRKHPKRLLLYGNGLKVDYDFKDIEVIYFKNEITERMKK